MNVRVWIEMLTWFPAALLNDSRVLWVNSVWFDQGKAWVVLNVEDMVFNTHVSEAIHQK